MDTKELELFVCLAETLHFGMAGERMHMSASTVSRSVKRMEEELGQRLLERDNRRVQLTNAGRRFLDYARQSLEQWRHFNEASPSRDRELRGEISLFSSVTASHSVLSPLLERFRLRHPGIELKLHTGDQADAIERVAEGHEDLSIATLPDKLSSRMEFHSLTYTPLRFIAPVAQGAVTEQVTNELLRGSPEAWADVPFIFSERGVGRVRAEQWFRARGIKPSIYAQVSGHEAIVSMVALGFGLGIVPELVLNASPVRDQVQVLEVRPELAPFTVGLCTLRQLLEDPLIAAFWNCAVSSYRTEI